MSDLLTQSNIIFVIGLLSILFSAYLYFREPQIKSDKMDALLDFRLTNIEKQLTNDMPHMDQKVQNIQQDIVGLREQVVRLTVVLEERLPNPNKSK